MSYVNPISEEQLNDLKPLIMEVYGPMGFIPNTVRVMAHRPEVVRGYITLAKSIISSTTVDLGLLALVAQVTSDAAGCRYCQAHAARQMNIFGTAPEKVEAVWNFERDARFSEAERAALRLARDAGVLPNAVTKAHFTELSKHYSEPEIIDLVANISLMGFFNRFNDTVATDLEGEALTFANEHLSKSGWTPGKHLLDES